MGTTGRTLPMVRALWGSDARHCYKRCKRDVDRFNDTATRQLECGQWLVVYCFGIDNYNLIKRMGHEARLVCESPLMFPEGPNTGMKTGKAANWTHKFHAIKMAVEEFGEILYTDWGTHQLIPLDERFFKQLSKGGSVQTPLVGYRHTYAGWRGRCAGRRLLPAGAFLYFKDDDYAKTIIDLVFRFLPEVFKDDERALAKAIDHANGGWQGEEWWGENVEPQHILKYRKARLLTTRNCEKPFFRIG